MAEVITKMVIFRWKALVVVDLDLVKLHFSYVCAHPIRNIELLVFPFPFSCS